MPLSHDRIVVNVAGGKLPVFHKKHLDAQQHNTCGNHANRQYNRRHHRVSFVAFWLQIYEKEVKFIVRLKLFFYLRGRNSLDLTIFQR